MQIMQKNMHYIRYYFVSVGTHVNIQKNPTATSGSRIGWGTDIAPKGNRNRLFYQRTR